VRVYVVTVPGHSSIWRFGYIGGPTCDHMWPPASRPSFGAPVLAFKSRKSFSSSALYASRLQAVHGRTWRDNVFVERLWRSVKYERVYLKAYDTLSAARADIADYLDWYNAHRPHSSVQRLTPDEKHAVELPTMKLAA
jgi:transposase InsO family protein